MKTTHASITASIMAFHRAVEMLLPEEDRVCQDALAIRFLPPDWVALLHDSGKLKAFMAEKSKQFPGVNGAIVSRVRFIDDVVLDALNQGLRQLVILGAGYDSRAYRLRCIGHAVVVFELDDQATQQAKLKKLEPIVDAKPDHIHYIPIDLSEDVLGAGLADSGYDPNQTTLFILEGLVPYITAGTFNEVLGFIAQNKGSGSAVVFDYLPPSVVDGTCQWVEGRNMYHEVNAHGEAFRLGFEKSELDVLLRSRGFEIVANVNAPDLKERFFHGNSANRPVTPVFWFAYARVALTDSDASVF